jgi:O-antigen ligase
MPREIALAVFSLGILILFLFVRNKTETSSPALWIPVIWVSVGASRALSTWLQVRPAIEQDDLYLEGSPLDRLIFSTLLAIGFLALARRGQRSAEFLRSNVPILVFFLYCVLSVFWSDYPEVTFKRWTKSLGNLVMVMVVLTEADPSAAMRKVLVRSSFLLIPISVLLIKYFPEFGQTNSPWTYSTLYTGITYNKNSLGAICYVFGIGSLWCFLNAWFEKENPRKVRELIAYGAVLVMTFWLFWKANSATSLICFLVGGALIIMPSLSTQNSRPAFVHLFIGGAALLSVLGRALLGIDESVVGAMGRNMTFTGRTELWEQLLSMNRDSWFGSGFESFFLGERLKVLWSLYWWHPNEAHNGYLEIFLTLGWIGVVLFGFVLAWGYRNVVRSMSLDPELGKLKLAYFLTALLYNWTEAGFKVMHPVWIVFLLSVAVIPTRLPRKEPRWGSSIRSSSLVPGR